ncbi:MAG: SHOCT domain-containing protein, partial [Planctomycetota bacterium]
PLPEASDMASTVFYVLIIIVLAVLVGIVAYVVRKRLVQPESVEVGGGLGFTLSDLRGMHEAGEIDDAEFARAKSKMLAHARADLADHEDLEDEGVIHLESDSDLRPGDMHKGHDDVDSDDLDNDPRDEGGSR